MSMLFTDWVKIAQSGDTVDGRTIEPQWLHDMAETYDPTTYTAVIWVDHFRWWGNQGTVHALEVRENGDTVELWATLKPSFHYLELNKEGQKIFFSIEPEVNFANTGKTYLTGLACTDEPASLGTTEARFFSKGSGKDFKNFYSPKEGCLLPNFTTDPEPPAAPQGTDEDEARNFFKKLFNALNAFKNGGTAEPAPEPPDTGDTDAMDEKQFKEFMDGMTGAMTDAIENGFTKLEGKFSAGSGGADDGGQNGDNDSGKDSQDGNEFSTEEKLEKLTTQFNEMAARLEQPAPFTKAPEGTGANSGNKLL